MLEILIWIKEFLCSQSVIYIRVTDFIFQPYRYVVACVTWLTPGAPFIIHTPNGDTVWETAAVLIILGKPALY